MQFFSRLKMYQSVSSLTLNIIISDVNQTSTPNFLTKTTSHNHSFYKVYGN